MTIGTVTLVLGGATASMFASLMGRMWYHDRRHSRNASTALEETRGSAISTVDDFTKDLMKTHKQMDEIEEQALKEVGYSVMERLNEHDIRVIEGSLTARKTTERLEEGANLFQGQLGDLLSAIGENRSRAEKSREILDSVASSIDRIATSVDGFSAIKEAFENIQVAVSESRDDIATIDESVSIVIETMNIPSGGRA